MNTQSNAVPESRLDSHAIAPTAASATRPIYWLVLRELWEYRSIYFAPLAFASLFVFAFMIGSILGIWEKALRIDPMQHPDRYGDPYGLVAGLIMAVAFIIGIFYSLDTLHGERRDRSILFWKSMPVSDLTTVLAKGSIPIVVLPLLTFAVTVAAQLIMLLTSTLVLMVRGASVATLWTHVPLFEMSLMLLYHLLFVHALWHAPMYGWLLLVSAWARRAPFLWALLPPLAIGVVEKIAFNTTHFASLVGARLSGPDDFNFAAHTEGLSAVMSHINPGRFLILPGLWTGLGFTAICIVAAARLRRYREPN
jgi:ABC-2 type transport system permease protein